MIVTADRLLVDNNKTLDNNLKLILDDMTVNMEKNSDKGIPWSEITFCWFEDKSTYMYDICTNTPKDVLERKKQEYSEKLEKYAQKVSEYESIKNETNKLSIVLDSHFPKKVSEHDIKRVILDKEYFDKLVSILEDAGYKLSGHELVKKGLFRKKLQHKYYYEHLGLFRMKISWKNT